MTMTTPMNEIDDLILLSKNTNALILGGAAKEGGDIRVYRDSSGNIALSFDADAASNAIGLNLYAGAVFQNKVTIGQTTLNTIYPLYVYGNVEISGQLYITNIYAAQWYKATNGRGLSSYSDNISTLIAGNINVSGTDSTNHSIKMQIDTNDIIVTQATGDGAGGITNKAIGLYGTTPTTQAAHIADPAESTAGNNAAIDAILVALENIGILAAP